MILLTDNISDLHPIAQVAFFVMIFGFFIVLVIAMGGGFEKRNKK